MFNVGKSRYSWILFRSIQWTDNNVVIRTSEERYRLASSTTKDFIFRNPHTVHLQLIVHVNNNFNFLFCYSVLSYGSSIATPSPELQKVATLTSIVPGIGVAAIHIPSENTYKI